MQERKKRRIRARVLALDLASLGRFGWTVIQGEALLDTVGSWTMVWALVLPGAVIFAAAILGLAAENRDGVWAEAFPKLPRSWNKWFTICELAALALLLALIVTASKRSWWTTPWMFLAIPEFDVVAEMVRRGAGLWFHRKNQPLEKS